MAACTLLCSACWGAELWLAPGKSVTIFDATDPSVRLVITAPPDAPLDLGALLELKPDESVHSIATTLWESRAALHHARMVERMSASDPATSATLQSLSALGMAPEQQYAFLNQMVNRQAFTLSALDLFYGSALLLVALIPFLWIARPPRRGAGASAAGAH